MSKFAQVRRFQVERERKTCGFFFQGENQVDSFRTDTERRKAFSANTFDSMARQGTYHSGIYNVPRTTVKT